MDADAELGQEEVSRSPAPAASSAIEILSLLADHAPHRLGVSEIARSLETNKASTLRVLKALHTANVVIRHPKDRTYALGPALIRLGAAAAGKESVLEVVRAALPDLAAETRMSAEALQALPDGQMICLATCNGPGLFSIRRTVGLSFPIMPPLGLIQFAWNTPEQMNELRSGVAAEAFAAYDQTSDDFLNDVAWVRQHGFTWSVVARRADQAEVEHWMDEAATFGVGRSSPAARSAQFEQLLHVSSIVEAVNPRYDYLSVPVFGLAAPVFDQNRTLLMQLCVVSLLAQMAPSSVLEIGRIVVEHAAKVTEALGGRKPLR